MWQLYLVLAISVLTSLCDITDALLLGRENHHWDYNRKSFGAESFINFLASASSLKPVGYVVYAL